MPAGTLWSVFTVSAVGGIFLRLMPKNSRITPYIQFLLSLILLLMLLSPLAEVLAGLDLHDPGDIFAPYRNTEGESFYDEAVISGAVMRVSSSLAAMLSAETGIPAEDMEISLTTEKAQDKTEIAITSVTVTLFCRAHKIAADKIRAAAERIMLCPCTVISEVRENA